MRLIDADALKASMGVRDAVKYGNLTAEQQHNSYSTMMLYEIADAIEDAPTIDAAPVVNARWKLDRPGHYTCTNCGTFLFGRMAIIMNYCGNCGAYMNRGEDENG